MIIPPRNFTEEADKYEIEVRGGNKFFFRAVKPRQA
jgi:hypothetical protein